ncbi:MAG: glycosyltransferase family 2 protein [Deltaproteobacteria bacterium]|nr:glycosyltransferase family 2 protein [Deltaproteobacteria bacterium]
MKASPWFDRGYYLARHPEMQDFPGPPELHYLRVGARLGWDPGPEFDTQGYLRANPDVAAGGQNPLEHFLRHGQAEGREPRPGRADHGRWLAAYHLLTPEERQTLTAAAADAPNPPLFSLFLVETGPESAALAGEVVAGLAAQAHPAWELTVVLPPGDPAARESWAKAAAGQPRVRLGEGPEPAPWARAARLAAGSSGDYLGPLAPGGRLDPQALYLAALAIAPDAPPVLLYGDEDARDPAGRRHTPWCKPAWNLELARHLDQLGLLGLYRREVVAGLGGLRPELGPAAWYDLTLRVAETAPPAAIRHLPFILGSRPGPELPLPPERPPSPDPGATTQALTAHFARLGQTVEVSQATGRVRLIRPLPPAPPLVSLIIPTRDQRELLARTVAGILEHTAYPHLEVIVVDNGSQEPATREYLAGLAIGPRCRVVPAPMPFNFSRLNNLGEAEARGEVLGFLNNDLAMPDPAWLAEMVGLALEPATGAVGALLTYPDGRVQHGGVVLGLGGLAEHAHKFFPAEAPGYAGRLLAPQEVSAVTAACLVLRREVFRAVGGFDEAHLAVAYNDVDLCLRVRRQGWRVVWTPRARLVHYESASRGADQSPEKAARLARESAYLEQAWGEVLGEDPFYSPNLAREVLLFGQPADPPRVRPPWRGGPARPGRGPWLWPGGAEN